MWWHNKLNKKRGTQMSRANLGITGVVITAGLGVAGCTTPAPEGGGPAGPGTNRFFAADAGTASKALADGKTLRATSGAGLTASAAVINWTDGSVARGTVFDIKKNSSGGVDVTVDDKTVSFAAGDADALYGWRKQDRGYNDTYAWSGTAAEVLDPQKNNNSQLWQFWLDNQENASASTTGFAAVGTETKPEALTGKAAASYTGYGTATLVPQGTPGNRTQIRSDYGNLKMTADFTARTVSGEATNLRARQRSSGTWGEYQNIPGKLVFGQATIDGNGFQGALQPDADLLGAMAAPSLGDGATYSGRFFGQTGQETAGVLSASGPAGVLTGGFQAWQD